MKHLYELLKELVDTNSINRSMVISIEKYFDGLITETLFIGSFTEHLSSINVEAVKTILINKIDEMKDSEVAVDMQSLYELNGKLLRKIEKLVELKKNTTIDSDKIFSILERDALSTFVIDKETSKKKLINLKDLPILEALTTDYDAIKHITDSIDLERLIVKLSDVSVEHSLETVFKKDIITLNDIIYLVSNDALCDILSDIQMRISKRLNAGITNELEKEVMVSIHDDLLHLLKDTNFDILEATILLLGK